MDIRLNYTEKGNGEPMILLHGNGGDHTYFKHQIEYFSNSYRVIAPDTRGHGKSPRGAAPFTIRQFARDLLDFMDEHGIEKAHLLGFSDGGNIALVFAMNYPHRVNRLILDGVNLNTKGVKVSVQIPILIGYKIASLFSKKDPNARKNAEMLGLMVNDPNIPLEELSKVSAKTLVMAGTEDLIKKNHTRFIYENLPDGEIIFLPGDHFIANKSPDAFNQAVMAFLRDGKE